MNINECDRAHEIENKVTLLISKMTLAEKIGQMVQGVVVIGDLTEDNSFLPDEIKNKVRTGQVGSVINGGTPEMVRELQEIARCESPHGIPLIVGRDVIHGYRTIFPIPLGQAATWNRDIVKKGAQVAAKESSEVGINWTFAPMIDVSRDPRWGRIAESLGEDPVLSAELGVAMIKGFQGEDLNGEQGQIAACAKHFVGYGATENGKDYNPTFIPKQRLRDVYFPPFKAAVDAGCATFMTAFNDINGIPASANKYLFKDVLRKEWDFDGFVVSDWNAMPQMMLQGFCEDMKSVAEKSVLAGVDMEMVSESYPDHLAELISEEKVQIADIDEAVANILRTKFKLGLFDNVYQGMPKVSSQLCADHLTAAYEAAVQSVVLLKNDNNTLPLSPEQKIAVIGPLADAPAEQIGCWVYDSDPADSVTPISALKTEFGADNVSFASGLKDSRDSDTNQFEACYEIASEADSVVIIVGEDAILSGEAHSRSFIDLPGAQKELITKVSEAGKPVVLVVMAGRPLDLGEVEPLVDSILYAWHPGTMGGLALSDLIVGKRVPSGKLPVSLPRTIGQVPIYYSQHMSGRPAQPDSIGIPTGTPLDPVGFTCNYMDVSTAPAYPFGFGLSYTNYAYSDITLSAAEISQGETIMVSVEVSNTGAFDGTEIVQLYIKDHFASIMRPILELKDFTRVTIARGETTEVSFSLNSQQLEYLTEDGLPVFELGEFSVFVGPSSDKLKQITLQAV